MKRNFHDLAFICRTSDIDCKKIVWAYFDDPLLFADSIQILGILIDAIWNFMIYALITFNPAKCRIIKYNSLKEIDSDIMLLNEKGSSSAVQVFDVNEKHP